MRPCATGGHGESSTLPRSVMGRIRIREVRGFHRVRGSRRASIAMPCLCDPDVVVAAWVAIERGHNLRLVDSDSD